MEIETEDPVVNIDPSGDIAFVVGPTHTHLHVHSMYARKSPIFNTMLGRGFAEGQQLARNSSVIFPLPEDDPRAMEIAFRVLYSDLDDIQSITAAELFEVAKFADKYDLVEQLGFAFKAWFSAEMITESSELWDMALAAYVLYDASYFKGATRALIMHHNESFMYLADEYENRGVKTAVLNRLACEFSTLAALYYNYS